MNTPEKRKEEKMVIKEMISGLEKGFFFDQPLYLVCIASLEGYFLTVNRAFTTILGYTEEELRHKPFIDFVHPQDKKKTLRELRRLAQGLDTVNFENRYLAKDGQWRWISWTCPSPPLGRKIVYAIASDVTDKKDLEGTVLETKTKLEKQAIQLEQKNSALKELIEQIENEKAYWANKWHTDLAKSILPDLRKLQLKRGSDKSFVDILRKLETMTQNYNNRIEQMKYSLSPREKEICELVKIGFTSKEIARMLSLSVQTVDSYRKNVRKKLGIQNEKVNLTACLKEINPELPPNNT